MSFEYLPHTADLKALIRAPDAATLYGDAAALVRDALVGSSTVRRLIERELEIAADDPGERLFRFVRELVFLYDSEGFLAANVELAVAGRPCTSIRLQGETFDDKYHRSERQIKALTRHEFSLERRPEGYRAVLLFDL